MQARIHCLGILVVDALSGPLDQYPQPHVRTQVVTDRVRFLPGGGAANTSGALGRMGLPVSVFSKVGDDLNGRFLLDELTRCGVDVTGIRVSPADTTPFTFVGIHPDGDRSFIHTPGSNLTFCAEDLDHDRIFAADYLLYQDCWVLPRLDGAPGAALLAEAQRRGVVTLLDECWGLGPRRDTFETMLPHCDFVLPSLDDMRALYADEAAEAIVARLLALGAKTVVLKMGAEGCLVANPGGQTQVPALSARVVDTTGAGDCWNAGFIAGLVKGADVLTAARLGHACAAFCIEMIGGFGGVPDYAAVVRRAEVML
ncbi:MAG: carbohydrate kinase family protein [bacterium]